MDIIGHCASAELSNLFSDDEIYGNGLKDLMFLNYMHCHDWAYRNVWEQPINFENHSFIELSRAHMIGDWVIHYGTSSTTKKIKCGWAYKKMLPVHRSVETFYKQLSFSNALSDKLPPPNSWNQKQRLDFGHTITELAFDLVITDIFIDNERLISIKKSLEGLSEPNEKNERLLLFNTLGITTDKSITFISNEITRVGHLAENAQEAADFPVGTAIAKYGISNTIEGYRIVRQFLESIAAQMDTNDVLSQLNIMGELIAQPDKLYTGALS